jgi:hypothetical protein
MTTVLDGVERAGLASGRHADRPLGLRWVHSPSEYGKKFGALALDDYCDTSIEVPAVLPRNGQTVGYRYGMLDNDTYGCCDPAAMFHCLESLRLRWGVEPYPWAAATCLAAYFAMNGVPPGPPGSSSDQGTDPAVGMNYWVKPGLAPGHTLLGWGFAPNTSSNLRRLIYEFGAGVWAVNLATEQQSQGTDWTWVPGSTPDSWGGHAIDGDCYDEAGFGIITWGEEGTMDDPFVRNSATGLFVPLTTQALNSAEIGPGGVAFAQMKSDLAKYAQGPVTRIRASRANVGKTIRLRERVARHLREAARGVQTHRCHWLRSLLRAPIVRVLQAEIPRDGLDEAERQWIAKGRELGWRPTAGTAATGVIRAWKRAPGCRPLTAVYRSPPSTARR